MKVKSLILAAVLVATAALAGCHTMAGAGQDIQDGGKAITNSADKHS